jgi:hypothetical protein
MFATRHQIACLVYLAWLADVHKVLCFIKRNLFLEFVSSKPVNTRGAFNGKISAAITDAYPNGTSATAADIALTYTTAAFGKSFIVVVSDQELTFYLKSTH